MDRKEYQRNLMAKRRAEKATVDMRIFEGIGHGIPVNGYVLVSKSNDDSFVVKQEEWASRLGTICDHGLAGWSCKACL